LYFLSLGSKRKRIIGNKKPTQNTITIVRKAHQRFADELSVATMTHIGPKVRNQKIVSGK
jgi:hypothetical protein